MYYYYKIAYTYHTQTYREKLYIYLAYRVHVTACTQNIFVPFGGC